MPQYSTQQRPDWSSWRSTGPNAPPYTGYNSVTDPRHQASSSLTYRHSEEPASELTPEQVKAFWLWVLAAFIAFVIFAFLCDHGPKLWRKWRYWRIEERCRQEAEQRRKREKKEMAKLERELKRVSQVETARRTVAAAQAFSELKTRLTHLREDADFRRCAEAAKACVNCAANDLRHVFSVFGDELLDQVVVRLSSGADKHELLASLRELVTALRLPTFEADYLFEAARLKLAAHAARRQKPGFSEQVLEETVIHVERVAAIEALKDSPETIEQLLEIEQSRHVNALTQLAAARRSANERVVTL